MSTMTIREIKDAMDFLAAEVGTEKCVATLYLNTDSTGLFAQCRPHGYGIGTPCFTVSGDDEMDVEDVLTRLRQKTLDAMDDVKAERLKKMAMTIISESTIHGSCSDASLRSEGFTQIEIDAFGAEACKEANAMADKGPFSIVVLDGANAA